MNEQNEPFVETEASPKTEHPCDTCPRHYPNECPNQKRKRSTTIFHGCPRLQEWMDQVTAGYLAEFHSILETEP